MFTPAIDGLPGRMFFADKRLMATGAADFAMHGVGVFCLCNMQRKHISVLKLFFPISGVAFQALGVAFSTFSALAFNTRFAGYVRRGGRNQQYCAKYYERYEQGSGSR
jgi:hypothetical protein